MTTDVHGSFFNTEDNKNSLAETAAYIKDIRNKYSGLILLDDGDVFQSSADTYFFNFIRTDWENPAAFVLNLLPFTSNKETSKVPPTKSITISV